MSFRVFCEESLSAINLARTPFVRQLPALVIQYHGCLRPLILNYRRGTATFLSMEQIRKTITAGFVVAALLSPGMASAQNVCFVDYKAKQAGGSNLQLHYGVMRLQGPACNNPALLEKRVAKRIAKDNWVLLRILSRFDRKGANQRQANAGQYFLRY